MGTRKRQKRTKNAVSDPSFPHLIGLQLPSPARRCHPKKDKAESGNNRRGNQERATTTTCVLREDRPVWGVLRLHRLRPLDQHVLQRVLHGGGGVRLQQCSPAELRQQGPVDHRDRLPIVDDLPIPELPGLLSLPGPWQQRLPWFLLHQRLSPFSCQRCLLSCPGLPLHRDDLPRQPCDEVGERNSWFLQLSLTTLSFKCADLKTRVSVINLYLYLIFELISPTSLLRSLYQNA